MKPQFASPLSWVGRDARLIVGAKGVRAFGQGIVAIIIASYMAELDFSVFQLGLFITVGVVGVSFFSFLVGLFAAKVGRRRLLITFSLISAGAAVAFFFIDDFKLLLAVAFVGALVSGGGGGGESAAQPLEMASLAGTAPPGRRTMRPAVSRARVIWARTHQRA